jgi:hypothetical protein
MLETPPRRAADACRHAGERLLPAEDGKVLMALVALITWLITASGGLYLLAIWLIEYDREFQSSAATRLPVPVISAHALLAFAGLIVWAAYLVTDTSRLAWVASATLGVVALLGLTMAGRWIRVYRTHSAPPPVPLRAVPVRAVSMRAVPVPVGAAAGAVTGIPAVPVPPERHFPLPIVVIHGVFAATTILLVLLTALIGT